MARNALCSGKVKFDVGTAITDLWLDGNIVVEVEEKDEPDMGVMLKAL